MLRFLTHGDCEIVFLSKEWLCLWSFVTQHKIIVRDLGGQGSGWYARSPSGWESEGSFCRNQLPITGDTALRETFLLPTGHTTARVTLLDHESENVTLLRTSHPFLSESLLTPHSIKVKVESINHLWDPVMSAPSPPHCHFVSGTQVSFLPQTCQTQAT